MPDDPEVPHTQQFRNFLKEHVVYKEVSLIVLTSSDGERWEGCMKPSAGIFGLNFYIDLYLSAI